MWTQKLSDQLNLAHVARKNMKEKKLKQTNASAHLVWYRFKIREGKNNVVSNRVKRRTQHIIAHFSS